MAVTITDHRGSGEKRPVWKAVLDQASWTTGHAASTETVNINGIVTRIKWVISDGGIADPNVVFTVTDLDGNTLFTTTEDDNKTVIDYAGGDFATNQLTSFDGFIVSSDPDGAPTTSLTVDIEIHGI
jgi:hypothetical protein